MAHNRGEYAISNTREYQPGEAKAVDVSVAAVIVEIR